MRYSIIIQQPKALEWELNLSQAFVFAFCYDLPSWADKLTLEGETYYFANRQKVIEELPILTDKPDTIYRIYKDLEAKNLIVLKKIEGRDYIALTQKAGEWNKANSKQSDSEKNPSDGKKSEQTRKKIRANSENFPTDNIIRDKGIRDAFPEPPNGGKNHSSSNASLDVRLIEKKVREVFKKTDWLKEKAAKLGGIENVRNELETHLITSDFRYTGDNQLRSYISQWLTLKEQEHHFLDNASPDETEIIKYCQKYFHYTPDQRELFKIRDALKKYALESLTWVIQKVAIGKRETQQNLTFALSDGHINTLKGIKPNPSLSKSKPCSSKGIIMAL